MRALKCARAAMSRALLYPIPDSCTERRLRHTVLHETREEPFERPLSNLIVYLCSSLFLKDCVAVYSQDVVDAVNSHTLSEDGKFRLRVLAKLIAFVHCSNDVYLAEELVRNVLSRSNSDSECDASSGNCAELGLVLHVTDPPLKKRCIEVVLAVDDFCFLVVALRYNFGVGGVKFLQEGRHQDRVTHDVTVIHVPQVCQASVFSATYAADRRHR